jgi:hypothetical protein
MPPSIKARLRDYARGSLRRHLLSAWAVILGGVLVVHVTMTLLYLTPENPLKVKFSSELDTWMNPHFAQRWSLFAPELRRDDRRLFVQCRLRHRDGTLEDTPFQDVEERHLAAKRNFKFTPHDRLHRVTNATTIALFGESGDREHIEQLVAQHPDDDRFKALQEMFDLEQQQQFESGLRLMGRVSAAECDRMYGHGRTVATRARIVMSKIPKFSDRNRGFVAESPTAIRLMWLPYEEVSAL